VYVSVANSLSGSAPAVHTVVEAAYRSILFLYLDPLTIQQLIDRAPTDRRRSRRAVSKASLETKEAAN
jgi:hypothetical protein